MSSAFVGGKLKGKYRFNYFSKCRYFGVIVIIGEMVNNLSKLFHVIACLDWCLILYNIFNIVIQYCMKYLLIRTSNLDSSIFCGLFIGLTLKAAACCVCGLSRQWLDLGINQLCSNI